MYAEYILSFFSMLIFFLINFYLGKRIGEQLKNENSVIFFALYPSILQVCMVAIMGGLAMIDVLHFSFILIYIVCLAGIIGLSYAIYKYCHKLYAEQALQLKLIRWILIYQTIWVAIGPITIVRLGML